MLATGIVLAALAGSALAVPAATAYASAAAAQASSVTEPADFDISEALLELGVNVSAIPPLASAAASSAAKRSPLCSRSSSCSLACNALSILYGSKYVFAESTSNYSAFIGAYWSQNQAEVRPYCVFQPKTTADVSVAILINRLTGCQFAAKSGGHSAYRGASNVPSGMTISFANLNNIQLSADKSTVAVGPGNVWGQVYTYLDNYNLTVIGGRLYDIGVGGLTTGGGISYLSNLYGWACDNVESYDVVLASGLLVRASATQYTDLFWALRGGGNNFGLVVNFNLMTYPLPNNGALYIGARTYLEAEFDAVDQAFYNLIVNSANDPNAGAYVVYVTTGGTNICAPTFYYADAANGATAAIWDEFEAIPNVGDTTGIHNIVTWTAEVAEDSPPGLREMYYTLTFKADLDTLSFARSYFFETVGNVTSIPGIVPNIVFQGITTPELQQFARNGGNALGLTEDDGPMFILLVAAMWDDASDDAAVAAFASNVLTQVKAYATTRGVQTDYTYMNYASMYQDVLSSYGSDVLARMRQVSAKYDPAQVYQTLQPGYFKLGGKPPVPNSGLFSY
ncbi:hypothetical protein SCUCBS95973_001579 [Sporothrix curviconia]|uniref:FAD-binding PCMH-type domain-containing protein n=1 Tax=Sporothrix curviconia TaxID=1260050 RepID=A0ABP0B0B7_9PEZI